MLGSSKSKQIILLEEADGTEEIPTCVAGILLKHDIPQLSHVAIRARQAGVLFVSCENHEVFTENISSVQRFMAESQITRFKMIEDKVTFEKSVAKEDGPQETMKEEDQKYEFESIQETIDRLSNPKFNIEEEYLTSNQLRTDSAEAVKQLGSKSVNSLRLSELSSKV